MPDGSAGRSASLCGLRWHSPKIWGKRYGKTQLEAVSPSATWGFATPWWHGPTYHGNTTIDIIPQKSGDLNYCAAEARSFVMGDSCAKIIQDDQYKRAFNISADIEVGPKTFECFIKLNLPSAEANDTGRTKMFVKAKYKLKGLSKIHCVNWLKLILHWNLFCLSSETSVHNIFGLKFS